jgi:RNA polymerase sigma-70 factor (ECF subfamily)
VAGHARAFRRTVTAVVAHPLLINGAAGLVNTVDGGLISVMSFTIVDGRIAAIDILSDPDRLSRLDLADLAG